MTTNQRKLYIIGFSFLALLLTQHWLQARMATHMAVQIPLLALLGGLLARFIQQHRPQRVAWARCYRTSLLLLALFILGLWMLPLVLDAALHQPGIGLLKWLSVPLAGLALVLSWPHLPFVLRGVLHLEALATLWRLGWLYLVAPQRYCVSYGLDDQKLLGSLLLAYGTVYGLYLAARVMIGNPRQHTALENKPG